MSAPIEIVGASAGSGKTTRVAQIISSKIESGDVRPDAVIATTFTRKAAGELRDRITGYLYEKKRHDDAEALDLALIGTVNSVCGQILAQFAFEAGLSPSMEIIDDVQERVLLAEILADNITQSEVSETGDIWVRTQPYIPEVEPVTFQRIVTQIMSSARINCISPDDFPRMAEESVREMLVFLEGPAQQSAEVIDKEMSDLSAEAVQNIKGSGATTDVARKAISRLERAIRDLTHETITWQAWAGLTMLSPGKESRESAIPVKDFASRFLLSHPRLHRDLTRSIELAFTVAARCLEAYQTEKQSRNLIDFVDQERLTYDLLRTNQTVRERLKGKIDILVVDEFQDTSPLQLALFMEMAKIAKSAVWVGDPKQAIYGFRGADPALMQAAVRQLLSGESEQLKYSYRSRPTLVEFTNAVFTKTFSDLTESQVKLTAVRTEPDEKRAIPPLIHWNAPIGDVASGIRGLLDRGHMVVDRVTKVSRPLRGSDIGVLCRSNKKADEITESLTELGISVSRSAPRLLGTREGGFLYAALRRYAATEDLASALDIALLSAKKPDPEGLLEMRLASMAEDPYGAAFLRGHPLVSVIDNLPRTLAPAAALDRIIETVSAREIAASFQRVPGESTGRIANVEAFRGLADRYEQLFEKLGRAATVGGFVVWISEIQQEELDLTAADPGQDAVCVLTIHSAKGLEWPVVISTELDASVRTTLWGVTVRSDAEVNAFEPLAARRIVYWPGFLGNTVNFENNGRIFESDAFKAREALAHEENKRLQYVNLTRARDCQIVCGTKFASLENICPPLPKATGDWDVYGTRVPLVVESLSAPEQARNLRPYSYFRSGSGPVLRPTAIFTPSGAEPVEARVVDQVEYGTRLETGKVEDDTLGNALHAFLAADLSQKHDRPALAARIFKRHGLGSDLIEPVIQQADAFQWALQSQFGRYTAYPEFPVQSARHTEGGEQIVRGQLDLILEAEKGLIIIDHKSYRGKKSDAPDKALTYSGQILEYRRAVESNLPGKNLDSCWINFFSIGLLVRLEF